MFFFFLSHQVYLSFSLHFSSFFFPNSFAHSFTFLSSEFFLWQVSRALFSVWLRCVFSKTLVPFLNSLCFRNLFHAAIFYEQKEEGTVDETRSNVPRKDAYACNFAGDSTREITVTLTLERKDKARGVFLRIVFKRCICTPTRLFITPAENCSRRASCYNLQRQTADNNDMNSVEAQRKKGKLWSSYYSKSCNIIMAATL